MHSYSAASLQEDVPLVHVPHEGVGSVALQRRWLRCLPVLGVCLPPAGPNARGEPPLEAEATKERRLYAVGSSAMLGAGLRRTLGLPYAPQPWSLYHAQRLESGSSPTPNCG